MYQQIKKGALALSLLACVASVHLHKRPSQVM